MVDVSDQRQLAIAGIDLIDRDHQALHRQIDRLQNAINTAPDQVAACCQELIDSLEAHIALETRLMTERRYPLQFSHEEGHASFRDQVNSILSAIDSPVINPKNVGRLLKKVHAHHVRYFDDTLSHYLADRYALEDVDDGLGI
jgi:hemerythrin-like metal-binding protein